MKKLLAILMILTLCLVAFVACKEDPKDPVESDPSNEVTYDVNAAITYVFNLYKDMGSVTASDFDVTKKVMIGGVSYDVVWTVSEGATITEKDANTVTVDINEKTAEEYSYKLTATITDPDGKSASKEFNFTVPKYELLSFEQYMAAKEGDTVVIEGIVVAINSKSLGNSRNHLFLADASVTGGYYSYQMDVDPVADLGIEIGMTVSVTGPVAPYSGMQEIKGGVPKIEDSNKKEVAPYDITEMFKKGESLKNYVALPVTIKGVTIGAQELGGTSEYLFFELDDQKAYIRTYVTDFPTTLKAEDKATIDAAHKDKFGWTANVTGILVLYNNNPYLIPTSVDCFEYLELVEKTAEEKIATELEALEITTSINADTVLELPLKGTFYPEVTYTWAVDKEGYTVDAEGKLPITLGAEGFTLKLTLTATCDGKTETKEITINVSANMVLSETKPYVPSLFQGKLDGGKRLYLDGSVSGRYLGTTDDPAKAVSVYAEKAKGGYKFYILVDGAKKYVSIYNNSDNKVSVQYDASNGNVFAYDATTNAWVTTHDSSSYYLGTYNTFNTVSASKTSYINAENTGVDQFPLEYTPVFEGVALNGTVLQAKIENGTLLYLDGTFGERYLNTTTDASKAVAIYAERAEDGYKFYILVDGAKQYLYLYKNDAGKGAVKFDAENANVFKYDAVTNAWTTVYDNGDYYLGTYNTFNTISSSKTSYINADNTGVDQFPLNFALSANATVAPETPETPDTDAPGTEAPTTPSEPSVPEGPEAGTVKVTLADMGWTNGTQHPEVALNQYITATTSGTAVGSFALNTGKYYDTGAGWRIYQSEEGKVTITASSGKTITSVKITYTVDKTGVLTLDGANVASDAVVPVNANSITFGVGNTGTATNGQVRISAIEVVYA